MTSVSDICPTLDQTHQHLLALLPQGRAWRSPNGGPEPASTMWKFWRAIATPVQALEARLCALRAEFFCATASETRPLWLADYGLPDACDPYPDLCTKVAASGGQTCAYITALAAKAGWSVSCRPIGSDPLGSLRLRINTAASTAYAGPLQKKFTAGCGLVGQSLGCSPDIGPVQCLLARILPAHLQIIWETV